MNFDNNRFQTVNQIVMSDQLSIRVHSTAVNYARSSQFHFDCLTLQKIIFKSIRRVIYEHVMSLSCFACSNILRLIYSQSKTANNKKSQNIRQLNWKCEWKRKWNCCFCTYLIWHVSCLDLSLFSSHRKFNIPTGTASRVAPDNELTNWTCYLQLLSWRFEFQSYRTSSKPHCSAWHLNCRPPGNL